MTLTRDRLAEALESILTPDRVESRLGTLEFNDGAPSDATTARVVRQRIMRSVIGVQVDRLVECEVRSTRDLPEAGHGDECP